MIDRSNSARTIVTGWMVPGTLMVALGVLFSCSSAHAQQIKACENPNGSLKVISPSGGHSKASCSGKETPLDWNIAGPTGAAGATGATGPTGATGATGATGSTNVLVFGGSLGTALDAVTASYMGPGDGFLTTAVLADGTQGVGVPMPVAGTLSKLTVIVKTGPTAVGDNWLYTVCVNDVCAGPLTCTIAGAGASPGPTTCSDLVNTVSYLAGDRLTLQAVPTNPGVTLTAAPTQFSATFGP